MFLNLSRSGSSTLDMIHLLTQLLLNGLENELRGIHSVDSPYTVEQLVLKMGI